MDSIDTNSLELYAEMMKDRYGDRSEQEDWLTVVVTY
jgi:hypothetical protein